MIAKPDGQLAGKPDGSGVVVGAASLLMSPFLMSSLPLGPAKNRVTGAPLLVRWEPVFWNESVPVKT